MPTPLNILIVEDSADDVEMIMGELRRAGFDPVWTRVETEPDFLAGLAKGPDLILSDYSMPAFDGLRAAELTQECGLHIPFILVSGSVGEDAAVDAMKRGVTDYFLKDRIAQLGVAVEHALEQKRIRNQQRQAEAALKLFRALIDHASDGIEVSDPETGRLLDVNQTTCERHGYTREEMLTLNISDLETKAVTAQTWRAMVADIRSSGFKIMEGFHRRKDGTTFPVEVNVSCVQADREYVVGSVRDISERKRAEEEIQNQLSELRRWHEVMLDREGRVLELKSEVNELLGQLKQPPRYHSLTAA